MKLYRYKILYVSKISQVPITHVVNPTVEIRRKFLYS